MIHNVANTLPGCTIHVFHGINNEQFVRNKCSDLSQVQFHHLKQYNLSLDEYNRLLTDTKFYQLFDTEYVLIFQTDSMLFPHSPFQITDFLEYDYYGAPWKWSPKCGGNGGLSLRKVSAMIQVLKDHKLPTHEYVPEDLFFASLPLRFPQLEVAQRFSVESMLHPTPFGTHKPWHSLNVDEYIRLQQFAPCVKRLFDLN